MNKNLKQIRNNVGIMLSKGAPEEDIDGYLASVGTTADEIKNYQYPGIVSAGLFANTAEGSTMGLADVLYGAGGASLKKLKNAISGNDDSPKVTRGLSGFTLVNDGGNKLRQAAQEEDEASKQSWSNLFNEYRKDFNDTKNKYNDYHGAVGTVADVLGSIAPIALTGGIGAIAKGGATAASKAGLSQLIKQGAKTGGKWGSAYGAGNAWTEGDDLTSGEAFKRALMGSLYGAGGGAIGGAAAPVLGAGVSKVIRPFTKQGKLDRFVKRVGKDKVDESINTNTALLENANEAILNEAHGIRVRGENKPKQRFSDFEKVLESGQKDKINALIDKHIDDGDYAKIYDELHLNANKTIEPLYADTVGKGKKVSLEDLSQSGMLAKRAKAIKADSDELANIPTDNLKVLQRVTQKIDSEVGKIIDKEGGYEGSRVQELLNLKNAINAKIDNQLTDYGIARGTFSKMKRKQDAMKMGSKRFMKLKDEELSQAARDIQASGDLASYKTGIAQAFRNKNFEQPKQNANAFRSVFNDDDLNRLQRMGILDDIKLKALKEDIYRGDKAIDNIHRLTSGSQTAEKGVLGARSNNPLRAIVTPKRTALSLSDKAWNRLMGIGDDEAALYLTDPKALQAAMENANPMKRKVYKAFWQRFFGGNTGKGIAKKNIYEGVALGKTIYNSTKPTMSTFGKQLLGNTISDYLESEENK